MMPRIAEIKEIDGRVWVRLEMNEPESAVTLWTADEIKEHKLASVRDFLIDQFHQWKDRI